MLTHSAPLADNEQEYRLGNLHAARLPLCVRRDIDLLERKIPYSLRGLFQVVLRDGQELSGLRIQPDAALADLYAIREALGMHTRHVHHGHRLSVLITGEELALLLNDPTNTIAQPRVNDTASQHAVLQGRPIAQQMQTQGRELSYSMPLESALRDTLLPIRERRLLHPLAARIHPTLYDNWMVHVGRAPGHPSRIDSVMLDAEVAIHRLSHGLLAPVAQARRTPSHRHKGNDELLGFAIHPTGVGFTRDDLKQLAKQPTALGYAKPLAVG